MRKKTMIYLVVGFLLIAFIVPFIISNTLNERLGVSINIISGICSFFTLIIAILLYNKYGIDKTIIDKKKEIVLDILEKIKGLTININIGESTLYYQPGTRSSDIIYKRFYNVELIFSDKYSSDLVEIFKHSKSLYTPVKIIEKLRKITPGLMEYNIENTENYGRVVITNVESDNKFSFLNSNKITFFEFRNNWDELIFESKKWLKENAFEDIDLNIDE